MLFSISCAADPNEVEDAEDEEQQEKRAMDFTRGEFFRDTLIPRALLYFTGEADQEEVCVCVRVRACVHMCLCCRRVYVILCVLYLRVCTVLVVFVYLHTVHNTV